MSIAPLFEIEVVRGLFQTASAWRANATSPYDWTILTRVASWLAAAEGHVALMPLIVEAIERGLGSDTFADHYAPSAVLEDLARAHGCSSSLMSHASARVRLTVVSSMRHGERSAFLGDIDLAIRRMAHIYAVRADDQRPWWSPHAPRPDASPGVEAMNAAMRKYLSDEDYHILEVGSALAGLPRALAQAIAPAFLTELLASFDELVKNAWDALVLGPEPLHATAPRIRETLARLAHGTGLDARHHAACHAALAKSRAPDEERARLAAFADDLLDTAPHPAGAPWKVEPGEGSRSEATAPVTYAHWRELVRRLARPDAWSEDRGGLHPRMRAELGRGLAVLRTATGAQVAAEDAPTLMEELAALVERGRESRRDGAMDAVPLALSGLLARLDPGDPRVAVLAEHPSHHLRGAYVRGVRTPTAGARRLLDDAHAEVRAHARAALHDEPPWRGLIVEAALSDLDAATLSALAPALLAIAEVPRVALIHLRVEDIQRLARALALLPARGAITAALAFLDDGRGGAELGALVRVVLAAEGGVAAWSQWLDQLHPERDVAWCTRNLPKHALRAEHDAFLPFPSQRRLSAARYMLTRARDPGIAEPIRAAWLDAGIAVWPDDADPAPLVAMRHQERNGSYALANRLEAMRFAPEWEATRLLLAAAREGLPVLSSWTNVASTLASLPDDAQRELMLDSAVTPSARCNGWGIDGLIALAATLEGPALATLLADPRLAPERLARSPQALRLWPLRRARLRADLADFAEALETMSVIAITQTKPEEGWTTDELAAYRRVWLDAANAAMRAGPGARVLFVSLGPPGLWEPIDEDVMRAIEADATPEEAAAVRLRRSRVEA